MNVRFCDDVGEAERLAKLINEVYTTSADSYISLPSDVK